jgi:hypothetical protein
LITNDNEHNKSSQEKEKRESMINDMAQVGAYLKKGGAGEEKTKQILATYGLSLNGSIYGKNFVKLKEDVGHAVGKADIYIWHIDGRGLQRVAEDWIALQSGTFSLRDGYNELQLITKEQKAGFRTAVHRCYTDKKICKPTGKRSGEYRKVEEKLEPIEIIKHKYNEYPIALPLDLDDWAIIRPANIIMIAGEKGSGKSAFCLNTALKNMNRDGIPIKYFSSEMRGPELTERLIAFEPDVPFKTWQESNVEFFYRRRDYMDVVDPNALNIIDYLEISDSFYNVADLISDIFDALKGGIALIALQKDKNTELGRGASFSMEKSRLYVTLHRNPPDGNIAKIVDAKTWRRSDRNPNYRSCNFKLINGSIMRMIGGWVRV